LKLNQKVLIISSAACSLRDLSTANRFNVAHQYSRFR
jgi:hypothetical protein